MINSLSLYSTDDYSFSPPIIYQQPPLEFHRYQRRQHHRSSLSPAQRRSKQQPTDPSRFPGRSNSGNRSQQHVSPYRSRHKEHHVNEPSKLNRIVFNNINRSPAKSRHPPPRRELTIDTNRARTNAEVLRLSIKKLGLKDNSSPTDKGEYHTEYNKTADIHWHAGMYTDLRETVKSGKLNKFPGMNEVTKKISLTRSLNCMKRLFPQEYDFYPQSWFIPHQLDELYKDFYNRVEKKHLNIPWFIVKPDDGSQGDNIYLIHTPDALKNTSQPQLVQEYITQPFLLHHNHLKFDLRVYAVIRSLQPLSIYVAREGMVRFCTIPYRSPSLNNSESAFMHLTNFSLNKAHADFRLPTSTADLLSTTGSNGGNKRLLSGVMHQIEARGHDSRHLWHRIKLIIVKTVLAMIPELIILYEKEFGGDVKSGGCRTSCFQILGFDILLKDNLEPMLLEVNACPSLNITNPLWRRSSEDQKTDPDIPTGLSEDDSMININSSTLELLQNFPNGYISMVDLAIKYPLVRDTLRLVTQIPLSSQKERGRIREKTKFLDDNDLDDKESMTLTEIFPAQYGATLGPMLFLHRAAYLFLHFIPDPRRSIYISNISLKTFIKKCNLCEYVPPSQVENVSDEIRKRWEGHNVPGIPFYGFIELLQLIAAQKYENSPHEYGPAAALRRLLHDCEEALRYYGVCTGRLRPDRESLASATVRGRRLSNSERFDLYLLPPSCNNGGSTNNSGLYNIHSEQTKFHHSVDADRSSFNSNLMWL